MPHHHVKRAALDRCRNDDLAHTNIEIGLQRFGGPEFSRAFEDDIDLRGLPGRLRRSSAIGKADFAPAYGKRLAIGPDRCAPTSVYAVEFQQMGGGSDPAIRLINMQDIESSTLERGALTPAVPSVRIR